jgi:hypothetical protein
MFCDQTTRKARRATAYGGAVGIVSLPISGRKWLATLIRTSVILVAATSAVLGGTLIASAQVSSGSPEAAQQNLAKQKTEQPPSLQTTDKPVQNDQQKTTEKPVQNDQQNATTSRPQEAPKSR